MDSPGEELLRVLAGKLGLAEDRDKAIKKASELRRLLKLKTQSTKGFVHLNETCIAVLCLDLASSVIGSSFDRNASVAMSCVTKPVYANSLHTIEKLLGIEKRITISSLCLQLRCGEVSNMASSFLDKYKCCNPRSNISHPMYACAAVLAALKQSRRKIDKHSLSESGRVKYSEIEKLAESMMQLRSQGLLNNAENIVRESERAVSAKSREQDEDPDEEETFEEWRNRILGN